jgi:hypothetical protein
MFTLEFSIVSQSIVQIPQHGLPSVYQHPFTTVVDVSVRLQKMSSQDWERVVGQLKARSRSTIHVSTSNTPVELFVRPSIPAVLPHNNIANSTTSPMTENSTNFLRRNTSKSGAKATNQQGSSPNSDSNPVQIQGTRQVRPQLQSGLAVDRWKYEEIPSYPSERQLKNNNKKTLWHHSAPCLKDISWNSISRVTGGYGSGGRLTVKFLRQFFEEDNFGKTDTNKTSDDMSRVSVCKT